MKQIIQLVRPVILGVGLLVYFFISEVVLNANHSAVWSSGLLFAACALIAAPLLSGYPAMKTAVMVVAVIGVVATISYEVIFPG